MTLTEVLLNIDKTLTMPVYQQISDGIVGFIRQGLLKPGTALPSGRLLAAKLKVHRKTVIAAYDELYAQNWVDIYPRKGIYVAEQLPDLVPRLIPTATAENRSFPEETLFKLNDKRDAHPSWDLVAPEQLLNFNDGFPDTRIAPVELLVREYRRFASYHFTPKYLTYGNAQGSENLRIELAGFLAKTRGLHVSPDCILMTKGGQMAIYLTAQLVLSKGDIVIAGDPGYFGANDAFEQAGGQLELVAVDEQGIDLDAVEEICKKKTVRLLYVIPHHHRPTTVTLSAQRWLRLLELAKEYRFAIIEDDYDYDFHYASSPILPLASSDYHGSVIYVGSFCKTIAPGIRIGFLVAPRNLVAQATQLRKIVDRQGEQLLEEAMANLLKNGDIGRHLKKANKIYQERRDVLAGLLKEHLDGYVSFKLPEGGFAIWMNYLHGISPQEVSKKTAELGLRISDGTDYYHDITFKHNAVRIGFASMNVKELEQAVLLLAKVVKKLADLSKR